MQLHKYQRRAKNFLVNRLFVKDELGAGLFLDPGLGKTLTTLAAIDELRVLGNCSRVLVIAPLRVVYSVWPQEIKKWGLDFLVSILHGPRKESALRWGAEIFCINPEGLKWLAGQNFEPFDLVVVDESTKFKNWSAQRSKILRKLLPRLGKRIILTGTPSPNGYGDLFSQMYIVDGGEALGKTQAFFHRSFCRRELVGTAAGLIPKWSVQDDESRKSIESRIGPKVLRLAIQDYLDMPDLIEVPVWVDLPPQVEREYRRLEDEFFAELENGETLTASSAGALYAICRGAANGGGYYESAMIRERQTALVHHAKTDAAAEIVEELWGKPVLIFYQFNHDRERLLSRFPDAEVIAGGQKPQETDAIISRWNRGEIPVLLAQPQAMAYGLNMQEGGQNIIWYGLTDSLETYAQANARLWRQGVKGGVRVFQILARGTVDEPILRRVTDKYEAQKTLLDTLRDWAAETEETEDPRAMGWVGYDGRP